MAYKALVVDYQKCTGCRNCELVCSVYHEGVANPYKARIKVEKWEWEGLYIPVTCRQCVDAPCMSVCPVNAIKRDEALGRVMVDHDVCIGCRSCVTVCPFGAMGWNPTTKKVYKCDLCDGDPQCVRFCYEKAVDYVEVTQEPILKKRQAAERIAEAHKRAMELSIEGQ